MAKHRAPAPAPTQVQRPWRTTARTVAVAAIGLLPALPDIADAAHISTVPFIASVLAVTAAITRILTLPAVDRWLDEYAPYLSADNGEGYRKDE